MTIRHFPRRLLLSGLCGLLLAVAAGPGRAAAVADGLAWLARAGTAARNVNYTGTYVYSGAGIAESARVTRVHAGGGDAERIESLDGARREIVRRGDEIHYFFLDSKTVRVDRRVSGRSFPDILPADSAALAAHYSIEAGQTDRVAGRGVQVIRLRARDEDRFSQEIWADLQTGLPLKLRVIDLQGEIVEQFAFTEVSIGERLSPKQARPSRRAGYAGWTVQNAIVSDPAAGGQPLVEPKTLPSGFRRVAQVSRQWPGQDRPVIQSVYSDGLASLSIFVDPDLSKLAGHEGYSQRGALGVYSRSFADRAVITVGQLPAAALRKVAESLSVGAGR